MLAITAFVIALMIAIAFFSSGCTIEVRPLKHKKSSVTRVHRKAKPTPSPDLSSLAPLLKTR